MNKQLFCATAVSEDIGRDKYVLEFLQDGNSLKSSKWEAKQNRNCATIFLIWKEEVLNSSCWVRNTLLDQVLALHLQSAVLGSRRYFQVTLGRNKSDCAGEKKKKSEPFLLKTPTTTFMSIVLRTDTSHPLEMGKKIPHLKSLGSSVSYQPTKDQKNSDRIIPSSSCTTETGAPRKPLEILFYSTLWRRRPGKTMKNTGLEVPKNMWSGFILPV